MVLLEQNYAHLPLKSAMYAISPVRRLRLLQDQTIRSDAESQLTDQQFHRELLSIFLSLRDLHTNYVLPAPYNRMFAFVPFLIEEFYEDGQRHYLVSQLIAGFNQPPFGPASKSSAGMGSQSPRGRDQWRSLCRQQPGCATGPRG